jgi:hypothetical protein
MQANKLSSNIGLIKGKALHAIEITHILLIFHFGA